MSAPYGRKNRPGDIPVRRSNISVAKQVPQGEVGRVRSNPTNTLLRDNLQAGRRGNTSKSMYEVVKKTEKVGYLEDTDFDKEERNHLMRPMLWEKVDLLIRDFLGEEPKFEQPTISDVTFDMRGLITLVKKGRWRIVPQMVDMLVHEYRSNPIIGSEKDDRTLLRLKVLKITALQEMRSNQQAFLVLKALPDVNKIFREGSASWVTDFRIPGVPFTVFVDFLLLSFLCDSENRTNYHLNSPSMLFAKNLSVFCRREYAGALAGESEGDVLIWRDRAVWVGILIAGIFISLGRISLAVTCLSELILFAPTSAHAYYSLFKVFLHMGALTRAGKVLSILKRITSEEESVIVHRAEVHYEFARGDFDSIDKDDKAVGNLELWEEIAQGINMLLSHGLDKGRKALEETIKNRKGESFTQANVNLLVFLYNLYEEEIGEGDPTLESLSAPERLFMLKKLANIYAKDGVEVGV